MSASTQYQDELQSALAIVHAASVLTKSVLRSLQNNVSAETKADDSPVTIADFAAQALIISALHNLYPSDLFLGEESADQLRKNAGLADRVWQLVQQARSSAVQLHASLVFPASKEEMLDAIDRGTNASIKGRVWVMDPVDGTAAGDKLFAAKGHAAIAAVAGLDADAGFIDEQGVNSSKALV